MSPNNAALKNTVPLRLTQVPSGTPGQSMKGALLGAPAVRGGCPWKSHPVRERSWICSWGPRPVGTNMRRPESCPVGLALAGHTRAWWDCPPTPTFCDALSHPERLEHLGLSWPKKGCQCREVTARHPLLNCLLFLAPLEVPGQEGDLGGEGGDQGQDFTRS